jgi:hypothetical protein
VVELNAPKGHTVQPGVGRFFFVLIFFFVSSSLESDCNHENWMCLDVNRHEGEDSAILLSNPYSSPFDGLTRMLSPERGDYTQDEWRRCCLLHP